ncbi:hypothetical protein HanIR_Chr07g0323411 [Helianthus annuus]|nr:hypothetical protein HanIR_Chr07g0323411 [Helianthus annuus]
MDDYDGMKEMVFGWSKEWNHSFQNTFHSLNIIPSTPHVFFHSIPSCTINQQHHNPPPSPQPTTTTTTHHHHHRRHPPPPHPDSHRRHRRHPLATVITHNCDQ